MKLFYVTFSRIGNVAKNHVHAFEAKDIESLEPEISEWVSSVLRKEPDQLTVTVDPDNKVGQLDYGLLGNFTISMPGGQD